MFQLNNLEESRSGGFVQTVATVIAVIISAVASFQFFATYSGGLLAGIVPAEFLSVAAGLIGVIMLEGATLYWQHSVQNDADSTQQLSIARTAYTVSLITSVSITALYFLLTSSLIAPYTADVQPLINAAAAFMLVGIISFQFAAKVHYGHVATKAEKSKQDASLRALQNRAAHQAQESFTRADLQAILDELQQQLPEHSRQRGLSGSTQYLRERYAPQAQEREPVNFQENGHRD